MEASREFHSVNFSYNFTNLDQPPPKPIEKKLPFNLTEEDLRDEEFVQFFPYTS